MGGISGRDVGQPQNSVCSRLHRQCKVTQPPEEVQSFLNYPTKACFVACKYLLISFRHSSAVVRQRLIRFCALTYVQVLHGS